MQNFNINSQVVNKQAMCCRLNKEDRKQLLNMLNVNFYIWINEWFIVFGEQFLICLNLLVMGHSGRNSNTETNIIGIFLAFVIIKFTLLPIDGLVFSLLQYGKQAIIEKQHQKIGEYFQRTITLAILFCFPMWTVLINTEHLLAIIFIDKEIIKATDRFATVFSFVLPAYIMSALLSKFLQINNKSIYPILIFIIISNILNIVLQYCLVYKMDMQLLGAALSTVISYYTLAILYTIYTTAVYDAKCSISCRFTVKSFDFLLQILSDGISSVVQGYANCFATNGIPFIILGILYYNKRQLSILAIISTIFFLTSSSMHGLSKSLIIVNKGLLTLGQVREAKLNFLCIIAFSLFFELVTSCCIILLSNWIGWIFISHQDIINEISSTLKVMGICETVNIIHVIQGAFISCGMNWLPIIIQLCMMLSISLPIGILTADLAKNNTGLLYLMISIWVVLYLSLLILILLNSDWKYFKQNIQQEYRKRSQQLSGKMLQVEEINTTIVNESTPLVGNNCSEYKYPIKSKLYLILRYLFVLGVELIIFIVIVYLE